MWFNQTSTGFRGALAVTLMLVFFPSADAQQTMDVATACNPSGWMGDAVGVKETLDTAWREDAHTPPRAIRVRYQPKQDGWGGIYWMNRPNNWCREEGMNLEENGFTRIVFWVRGDTGREIIEFKGGGIFNCPGEGKIVDSFEVRREIELTTQWTRQELDLRGKNLSSVIGCFAWVASAANNPEGATFYLDDITYE